MLQFWCILIPDRLQWALKKGNRLWLHWIDIWDGFLSAYFIRKCTLKAIDGTWHALHTGMKSIMKENYLSLKKCNFWIMHIREHSYMTSDVFRAFLTYLPTIIRYFTTSMAYLGFEITGAKNFTGVSYRPFLMHRFSASAH